MASVCIKHVKYSRAGIEFTAHLPRTIVVLRAGSCGAIRPSVSQISKDEKDLPMHKERHKLPTVVPTQ